MDGKNLKYLKPFTYLGSKMKSNASLDNEINRIAKTTSAFGKLRHRLWNERAIKLDTKMRVYRASVLTTLLYGSELWIPYSSHINQLDIFHKVVFVRSVAILMIGCPMLISQNATLVEFRPSWCNHNFARLVMMQG